LQALDWNAMHTLTLPEKGPKLKLVTAAEQLFAERGFDAVSVRDVTKQAGANAAAVNYHFGSRAGLILAVVSRYLKPINTERMARLQVAEQKWSGKPVPVEEIVEAFARPLVRRVRHSEISEKMFHRLLGRIMAGQDGSLAAELEAEHRELARAFLRTLGKALPSLATEEVVWRMHFMNGALIHLLTHGELVRRVSDGAAGNPTMETSFSRFLRFVSAGLRNGVDEIAPGTDAGRGDPADDDEDDSQALFHF